MPVHTFRKPEHLCRQKEIDELFGAGCSSFTAYPVRATFRRTDHTAGPPVKVLLSVAKRRLHRAVDRNRAKRQLREAYRLQKQVLTDVLPEGTGLNVALIWLADRPVDTALVMQRVRTVLLRTADRINAGRETKDCDR